MKIFEVIAKEPDPQGYQRDLLPSPQWTLIIDTPGELDWYKIGQHYPRLNVDDPHEYGQPESDMQMTFANQEEMWKAAQNFDRLGINYKPIGGTTQQPEIHDDPKIK
jgi:hypothetical protein